MHRVLYRVHAGPGAWHLWQSFPTQASALACAASLRSQYPSWAVLVEAPESRSWLDRAA